MVYARPAKIDYPPINKNEELFLLNSLIQSGRKSISMDKPELICKLHHSTEPIYEISNSNISKAHQKILIKIIKDRKEQRYC